MERSHSTAKLGYGPERSPRFADVRRAYRGWIEVKQSAFDRFDEYLPIELLRFDGGWISVQSLKYSTPVEIVWKTEKSCYEFGLALTGRLDSASAVIEGMPGSKPVGRVYMVPPDQTIRFTGLGDHRRALRCCLDARLIDRHLSRPPQWRHGRLAQADTLSIGGGEIEWILRRMYRELSAPDFASTEMVELLAQRLAVEVIRSFGLRDDEPRQRNGGLAPWRLRLMRDRVQAEGAPPSVSELAQLCGMTVRHLSRTFREETGGTIGKFIEAAVMQQASTRLLSGESVGAVAAGLGYGTSGSFAAAFRRATGILPSELRARQH